MIDVHCHLQDDAFDDDLDEVLAKAKRRGITRFVVNGTSESDWEKVATLARTYPEITPFFGLHPWYIDSRTPRWLDKLTEFIDEFPHGGVGETGLDRWIKGHDIQAQTSVFEAQWQLAIEKDRPVTVHCLKAWGHLEQCLKNLPTRRFLLHSYSGSREMTPGFSALGAYFSISGYFLRPDKLAKLELFDHVPEDRLLIETDAPAMNLPSELDLYRESSFNHPENLATIYQEIANRKGMSIAEFKTLMQANFKTYLGLAD